MAYACITSQTSLVITPTATGAVGKSTLLATGVGGNPTAIEWQGGYEDMYVKTPKGLEIQVAPARVAGL